MALRDKFINSNVVTLTHSSTPTLIRVINSEYVLTEFIISNNSEDPQSFSLLINVRGDHDENLTKFPKHYLFKNYPIAALESKSISKILLTPGYDVWANSITSTDISISIMGIIIV